MFQRSLLILPLLLLSCFAGLSSAADGKSCFTSGAKVSKENKRFSVLVPRASGLGSDQTYDDIGCAVLARNEECAMRQTMFDGAAIAYDHSSEAEIPAEKAWFVLQTDVRTPRGFGIVAFKDKADAEKFSASHGKGKVIRWFDLVDEKLQ